MGKHGPARNKPQSLKKDLGKKPQKGRSGGTKSEPVCRLCGSRGHYTSTCPRLAQKLLQAVRKSAGSKDISDFLATNAVVRVQGLKGKPQRTAKKASGKRQKSIAWKKARLVSSSKRQRKKQSKTKCCQRQAAKAEVHENFSVSCWHHFQSFAICIQFAAQVSVGLERKAMCLWSSLRYSAVENLHAQRLWAIVCAVLYLWLLLGIFSDVSFAVVQ